MIVVVGAGVVGLTCAVRLAEAGHRVRVVTREPPLDTTSAVAGAFWFPYLAAPPERVAPWAASTYATLASLAERVPESGVVMRELLALGRERLADPPGAPAMRDMKRLPTSSLPAGYGDGWTAVVPVVEPPRHLPWLITRLAAAGGSLEVVFTGVPSLAAAGAGARVVVHCSGLGARALAGDGAMVAVRGQVALVENPGLERVVLDDDDPTQPTYVIPRRDGCVVGGTAEPLSEPWGAAALAPDPAVTAAILARATRLVPALAGARLLATRVGLRPVRPTLRLELERPAAGPPVVHCYGHGGSGYTLAWGCADEVVALVESLA